MRSQAELELGKRSPSPRVLDSKTLQKDLEQATCVASSGPKGLTGGPRNGLVSPIQSNGLPAYSNGHIGNQVVPAWKASTPCCSDIQAKRPLKCLIVRVKMLGLNAKSEKCCLILCQKLWYNHDLICLIPATWDLRKWQSLLICRWYAWILEKDIHSAVKRWYLSFQDFGNSNQLRRPLILQIPDACSFTGCYLQLVIHFIDITNIFVLSNKFLKIISVFVISLIK